MTSRAETTASLRSAEDVLAFHSRSFHFAKLFLSRKHAARAARLYVFCRHVDDLADLGEDRSKADDALRRLQNEVLGLAPASAVASDLLDLSLETGLKRRFAIELIDGVRTDLRDVALQTQGDLIRYAYQVAGTVGLMMCSVLEVREVQAEKFAIDLGIAMQLTNIARDVVEDAERGRRYLPGGWTSNLTAQTILNPDRLDRQSIAGAVEQVLVLAEKYYESALHGFGHLPLRARFAMFIAARIYRRIGIKLERRQYDVWMGRTTVATPERLVTALQASWEFAATRRLHHRASDHQSRLHRALHQWPGAEPGLRR